MWLPLAGVALRGVSWKRDLRAVFALFRSLWQDWTLLTFIFMALCRYLSLKRTFEIGVMAYNKSIPFLSFREETCLKLRL